VRPGFTLCLEEPALEVKEYVRAELLCNGVRPMLAMDVSTALAMKAPFFAL
jgi:hypothetical protein